MKQVIFTEQQTQVLYELCSRYDVSKLYAFGSVLTPSFNEDTSDLDFLVELEELPPLIRGERLIAFWESLELLFSRKVDLLTNQHIRNPYLKSSIDKTKQLIYDRKNQKVLS